MIVRHEKNEAVIAQEPNVCDYFYIHLLYFGVLYFQN